MLNLARLFWQMDGDSGSGSGGGGVFAASEGCGPMECCVGVLVMPLHAKA